MAGRLSRPADTDYLVGIDGPAVVTSARIAHVVAPMARTWLDAGKGRISPELHVDLQAWVDALEVARAAYGRSLASADGVDDGTSDSHRARTGDSAPGSVVSSAEAGHRLAITPRAVTGLCNANELHGFKVGRQWLIYVDSIEAFEARRAAR